LEKPMSQNLNLLRQNHCRPATVAGKTSLFRLEKECDQGKTLLAKAPATLLELQQFDPYGLLQTYQDEATGAELPLFAVFDLEGDHQRAFEITTQSVPAAADSGGLPGYIPLQKTQAFVRKINERRMKVERAVPRISLILGSLPPLIYLCSPLAATAGANGPWILVMGWALSLVLAYLLSLHLLDRLCPWKKLIIHAEFDGILPKDVREKARAAKDHFDNLYLVVDQQRRWKSEFLPDPRPFTLDPLLIGELKQGRRRRFYVIDQFDLTDAERYLADEFATRPGEDSSPHFS
jgi:hypothetical protein